MVKVWINGKIINEKEASIPISIQALHYGTGVFESILCFKKKIFRLEDHIARFIATWKILNIKTKYSKEDIKKAIIDLIRANKGDTFYIRLVAFKNSNFTDFSLNCKDSILAILLKKFHSSLFIFNMRRRKVKLRLSEWKKERLYKNFESYKLSGRYLTHLLIKHEAMKRGYEDSLFLDINKNVLETTTANIFFVKDNSFITPKSNLIINGITRDTIIEILKDVDLKVEERKIKASEIKNFNEAFLTSTAYGILSISSIENKIFLSNKMTSIVREKYIKILEGKDNRYYKWLTFIR